MEMSIEPPCCMIPGCRFLCEKNPVCVNLGKIGMKYFDVNRGPIMLFTAFVAILCTLLTMVSLIGASYETDNIKNCGWTYGENDNGDKIWAGLNAFVVESNGKSSLLDRQRYNNILQVNPTQLDGKMPIVQTLNRIAKTVRIFRYPVCLLLLSI